MDLDERNKKVLCAVIQCYINSPGPVGSRVVTKKYAFGLSPATIRNIMADLEEMGYLQQPHTSAGRVPTDSGYRFYVDTLASESDIISKEPLLEFYRKLENLKQDMNSLHNETSKMLSSLSHYVGIAIPPNTDMTSLVKIDLLKYKENQVAVFLLTEEGVIRNKVVSINPELSQRELNRLADYINTEFAGRTLEDIRETITRDISHEKIICDRLIEQAIKICDNIFSASPGNIYVSGLSEMLELPDFYDITRIKELLRTIEDKQLVIKLLDKIADYNGTQVFIGSENPLDEMKNFSFVVSTYKEGNKPLGAIGIIGPTRMDYYKTISIVDMTAKFINNIFSADRKGT